MVEPSTDDEIENILNNLGLCKYEARAYLTLLKHGPQNYKGLRVRLIDFLHHDPAHHASTRDVLTFSVSP